MVHDTVSLRHAAVTIGGGFSRHWGLGYLAAMDSYYSACGAGTAWLELSGELVVKNLAPGETLRCIRAMWARSRRPVGFRSPGFGA